MSDARMSIGDVLSGGWRAFVLRWPALMLVAAVVGAVQWALGIIWARWVLGTVSYSISNFNDTNAGYVSPRGFVVGGVAILVVSLLLVVASAAYYTSIALSAVDDEGADAATINANTRRRFWPFFGWTLLAGLCIWFGSALCVIPGLVAVFFLLFVPFYAQEHPDRANPFRDSGRLALSHPGQVIVLMLVGIGLLVGLGLIAWVIASIFGTTSTVGELATAIVMWVAGFAAFGFFFCSMAALYRGAQPATPGGTTVAGPEVT